jgi:DNA repair protein RadC
MASVSSLSKRDRHIVDIEFLIRGHSRKMFNRRARSQHKPARQRQSLMNLFTQNIAEVSVVYKNTVKAADRPKISCSRDASEIMRNYMNDGNLQIEHREYFFILLLNRANKVLGVSTVSMGGMSGTVADPKIIFQTALKVSAASIILCHNHPSGNIKPSESDIRLTQKIKKAGSFLDLPCLDHIILTEDSYFSFADEGML